MIDKSKKYSMAKSKLKELLAVGAAAASTTAFYAGYYYTTESSKEMQVPVGAEDLDDVGSAAAVANYLEAFKKRSSESTECTDMNRTESNECSGGVCKINK